MSTPPPPADLALIAARCDERIRLLLDAELARWAAVDPALVSPLDSLRSLVLAGGKRLRPAFCWWSFIGAGGDPADTTVVDAGAGLELLHTFALIHDDIMDGSTRRRGMDAVHVQFMDAHRGGAWMGEGRRFGEGAAILIGDLAFVYADVLMTGVNPAAAAIFNELRVEVNIGQYLDLLGTVQAQRDAAAASRICTYKSGKYTIERPLHLGAALAGRLDELTAGLSAYGLPLGEAFQLRDDLLGAFGDDARTGKPVGDDLREGKPTALLARAFETADAAQRSVLAAVGDPGLSEEAVRDIQAVLVDTGAAAGVERHITCLRDAAISAVRDLPLSATATEALVSLAYFVTDRDH